MSSATAPVAPTMLKVLPILLAITLKKIHGFKKRSEIIPEYGKKALVS